MLTHPILLAGIPATNSNGFISLVTTAPAATNPYLPISVPQRIVEFAPNVAPWLTIVSWNSDFLFTSDLGLITFVKTTPGPQKTLSFNFTPSNIET